MRIAVFFTPPAKHRLTVAAARWLLRDAFQGVRFEPESDDGFSQEELEVLTAEPRRYGFHATMKAPFRLAEGATLADAEAALADFCRDAIACPLPSLRLAMLGPFFALVPDPAAKAVDELAARVVRAFEPLRAPLDAAELNRRRRGGLTLSEEANMAAWGYPYVFDEFRFHMTLTGPVPAERQPEMEALLHRRFDRTLARGDDRFARAFRRGRAGGRLQGSCRAPARRRRANSYLTSRSVGRTAGSPLCRSFSMISTRREPPAATTPSLAIM